MKSITNNCTKLNLRNENVAFYLKEGEKAVPLVGLRL